MVQTWDEYAAAIRAELYRLNMELTHWEACGDRARVDELKTLIASARNVLESEKRPGA